MTKKDLIKHIEDNSGETESWGNLNSMLKPELEKIYDYVNKVNDLESPSEIDERVDFKFDDNFFLDTPDADWDKQTKIDELPKKVVKKLIPTDEYVNHKKPSTLSINQQRAIKRSGRAIKNKENKYSRFGKEDVKFEF